jgi:hypothetical protein
MLLNICQAVFEFLRRLKSAPYMFETGGKQVQIKGASPAESGVEDPDKKVDFSKMTYEEIAQYQRESPDAKL